MSEKDTKTEPKKRKPRTRRQYLLVEVTEDENTKQPVFAIVESPPLDGASPTPRRIIDAARKAVYEDGQKQYGNKKLAIVQVVGTFDVPFIERMALTPPS